MKRTMRFLIAIPVILLVVLVSGSIILGIPISYDAPALEFPIYESDRVVRLSAYHTPDWGEPGVFHDGIDLVISGNVTIVSPVKGIVISRSESINPYAGNVLFDISILVNWGWHVSLVLEPGFRDSLNNSRQTSMITAYVGQRVEAGDSLGTLLYSENYPHLHYMLFMLGKDVCAYNYSTVHAKGIFDDIAQNSGSKILYPYTAPSILLCPFFVIPMALAVVYTVISLVILRRSK